MGGGRGRGQGTSTCTTIQYMIMPHNVDLNFHALFRGYPTGHTQAAATSPAVSPGLETQVWPQPPLVS